MPMGILLTSESYEWSIAVPIGDEVLDALCAQIARSEDRGSVQVFTDRLARTLSGILIEALDWDLKPPTTNQISFARSICNTLQIELPSDARQSRARMTEFIELHVPRFHEVRKKRTKKRTPAPK